MIEICVFLCLFHPARLFTTWQMLPVSVMASRVPAVWKPVGFSWPTSGVLESSWKRNMTVLQPCGLDARYLHNNQNLNQTIFTVAHLNSSFFSIREDWSFWTSASTPPPLRTWSTLIWAQITATATKLQALWAHRGASATKPLRAWTAASWCAAAAATTSSASTNTSAATASSTGVATSNANAAQRWWTSLCVNSWTVQVDGV